MSQKITVSFTDDISGTESTDVTTRRFSLGGTDYEIDLGDENYGRLEAALEAFIVFARKAGGAGNGHTAKSRPKASRQRSASIRSWAREQGLDVNDRGRISGEIVRKYEAAR